MGEGSVRSRHALTERGHPPPDRDTPSQAGSLAARADFLSPIDRSPMAPAAQSDTLLIRRIREGEAEAWSQLISRFEGRLLAYVERRVRDRVAAEDVVQETFIGFLTSLPNYDLSRPLETYLFSIAAHKLTDHLRRQGRRPMLPLAFERSDSSGWEPASPMAGASSIARSGERRHLEETALVAALSELILQCRTKGQWEKLQCAELLFVRGLPNKDVASALRVSEQTVANYKFEFVQKLRGAVRKQGLAAEIINDA